MGTSTFTGPGEILLAPSVLGDVMVLPMHGDKEWKVSRDSFLAHTTGIEHDYVTQGFTKGMFSGAGFFVYKMTGVGLLWMQSFGAIIKKEVCLASLGLLCGRILIHALSSRRERSTTSTTVISLLGTVTTSWNVLLQAESSPRIPLMKVLRVNSKDPVRFIYRQET